MNSLWTSSIHWFINCSCARSESVESQEMVFGLGMLQIEVLVVGVYHLVVFPTGAVRLGRRPREIIVGCCGVRCHPSKDGASYVGGICTYRAEGGRIVMFNGCDAFSLTVGTTLCRAMFSSISSISIGETDDREYDTQSDRRAHRSGVSGLLGCRGGRSHSVQADVLRLTSRDNMALGLAWSELSDC
ncbi:hypothetical protein BHE74_00029585 [Ensete ventricosum]|nr:hypothetical protein BHE74_00029585 [Ensete ventricosum]